MKMRFFPVMFCLFFVSVACNKNNDDPDYTYSVEYKIQDANNTITSVSYNDAQENYVTENAPSQTATEWKKTLTVSRIPFIAKLESTITNNTGSDLSFTLLILVNGQVKKSSAGIAPTGAAPVTTTAQFTVN